MKRLRLFLFLGIFSLCLVGCSQPLEEEELSKTFVIVDEVSEKQLSCDSALETFYEDDNAIYKWSCIKNSYMKVQYSDGSSQLVSDALESGAITIADLDNNHILYEEEMKIKDIFDGEILLAEDTFIVVKVLKDSQFFQEDDEVRMLITRPISGVNDFYVVGNKVRISFNGMIEYSDPVRISPSSITLITD